MHNWATTILLVIIACMKYTQSACIFLIVTLKGSRQSGAGKFITLSECNKRGLTGCIETPSDDNCTQCSLVFLWCIAGSSHFLDTHHVFLM